MSRSRRLVLGLVVAALGLVAVGWLVAAGPDSGTRTPPRTISHRAPSDAIALVGCSDGAAAATGRSRGDVAMGPIVLVGARATEGHHPDAFGGHGYKVPTTLPDGVTATLAVPEALRSRVGLVFSAATQRRVLADGPSAADRAVRFAACPAGGEGGRTGWAGGVVVDPPRCATLVVTVGRRAPLRRRVPLGRRC